jgi:bacteriocin resistance YdeI/OmpD-like protein
MSRANQPNKTPQPMPGNVKAALAKRKLTDAFAARPDYQRNEYLKWIALAAGPAAKDKRLQQMLDEVENGGLFKGEPWTPPAPVEKAKSSS